MPATAIGVAIALVFREKWDVVIGPSFANELGERVLDGSESKVGGVGVVTSIAEIRRALLEPIRDSK